MSTEDTYTLIGFLCGILCSISFVMSIYPRIDKWKTKTKLKTMSVKKVLEGIDTKEGLMLLISQVIKDTPNDQDLGKKIRSNFQNYLEEE